MPMQVLINLFIGVLWMFFQDDWSILTFSSGYLFGILVLFILRRFLDSKFYLFTLQAVVELFFLFIYELFTSSIMVIREIIKPKIDIKPGIFSLETSLESDVEVTLLALLITLTPGSVVMEISPDKRMFYIHAMDIPELSDSVIRSKEKFEDAIKKVTRL
ncbi:MAG TPA: Na+/H+ antiporter subunit E [Desulfitobacterium dehalogenans]|uniref:Na+/H+ antiporter subunit E n=1 Tax=Desulfitobacterium dehalogenans TaxID=36854 RepID=A0A7C7DBE4_9FIRM|nr:Na+/H+ antiporter subunit E [Desulfitobacterium dehalogenans]